MSPLIALLVAAASLQEVAPAPQPAPTPDEPAALEVLYLANEGFLLRRGEIDVLIDAFVEEPYAGYAGLPPELSAHLRTTTAPFDSIELALVSHAHGDHFQEGLASAFLKASTRTRLVSSPQVVDALRAALGAEHQASERLEALLPEAGARKVTAHAGVGIELLWLPHGGMPSRKIQNLGHLITIGDMKILHVGDADMIPAAFAPYRLAEEAIDVAILPYWYFVYPGGRRLVQEHLPARLYIAAHIAPSEHEKLRAQIAARMPQVVVFDEALETRRVEPRKAR